MKDFIKKYSQRAKVEGHLQTWLYLLGNFIFPKIGIQVKYIFFNNALQQHSIDDQAELALLDDMSQLTDSDKKNLIGFEGDSLVDKFRQEFSEGCKCVIVRNDSLASACWIAHAPDYLQDHKTESFLIRDCFTLPAMRGRGMYPKILDFAIKEIQKQTTEKKVRIVVNSIFSNRSSIRGILKSGFIKAGTVYQIGKNGFAIFKSENKRIFKIV